MKGGNLMKNDFKNTRRGGFYPKDNQLYLSTTEILKILNKPAITYWYGQQVYYAMLKNPTLNEKEALSAPYQTTDSAKERGKTVHSIIEAYKTTGEVIDTIPEQYKGYAKAFYQAVKDLNIKILEQEKTLYSDEHKLAGTLDIYAQIGDRLLVIDTKTGKNIYQEAGLQLSSYAHMLRESSSKVDGIAVLLLETGDDDKPTGQYKFETLTEDFDAFLACLKLYSYVNRAKLLKLGYLNETE